VWYNSNMKEITGNLWDYYRKGYPVCITTNGTVRKDGTLVMGAGCALEAVKLKPTLPLLFGKYIKEDGNVPHAIYVEFLDALSPGKVIISFPVKHDWFDGHADIELIEQSARKLVELIDKKKWETVIIPRPGCGLGKRDWKREIQPILTKIFDDRFWIISKEGE